MILIRRYYSDSKYAETEAQAKKRESDAAKLVLSTGGLGAALAARSTLRAGGDKLSKKVTDAVTKDAITLDKINKVVDKINARGVKPEDAEKAQKFLNETVKNRFNHNVSATKMSTNGLKKLVKASGKSAVKGAAIGGVIGAGLYGLSRKNLIKQNEEKNRRLAMRRERLAGKQKEN
jgi:hypothetical protein